MRPERGARRKNLETDLIGLQPLQPVEIPQNGQSFLWKSLDKNSRDLEKLGEKAWRPPLFRHLPPSPRSASSMPRHKSSTSSIPADIRSRSTGQGEPAPSTEARCSISDSTPPSEVARFHSFTRAAVAIAAASPPRTRIESMPPNPPRICRFARSCPG